MSPNSALSTAASPALGPPTAHTAARLIFPTFAPMYKRPDRSVATVAAVAVAANEQHWRDNNNRTIHHNHDHHVTGSTICTTTNKSDPWRRYGRARRQWLVDNDAQTFRISKAVDVEQYYGLGHRIWVQLLELKQDSAKSEDAYTLACRFQRFLESDLPRHPQYVNRDAPTYPLLNQVLDQLAIRIDEEQLNKFVDTSMDPEISIVDDEFDDDDDDDDDDYEDGVLRRHQDGAQQWETFSGWSFDVPESADTTDDSSSYSRAERHNSSSSSSYVEPRYQSFLDHIATQSVEYESDSEAADSWAPSVCSSAFAQQLHRHQMHLALLQRQLEKLQADDSM